MIHLSFFYQANLLENRCEIGMGVCSLIEQEKYGICVKKTTKATCVVLDKDSEEKKYLLNVDANRLQSFSDINYVLCFYKNAIYEVSDINYSIKLNYRNNLMLEISTTRRNFMKRFLVVDDSFNKNFPKDKQLELNFVNKCPLSFDEIIGKSVGIKASELLKFKNNLQLKQLLELIELENEDTPTIDSVPNQDDVNDEQCKDEIKTVGDLIGDEHNMNKENKPLKISDYFKQKRTYSKSTPVNRDRQINFTVSDVQIYEVIMNCIKDFVGSNSDQDFKTEKISGDQLEKVKFFKINDKNVELGSRWKLNLTEEDRFVGFSEYEDYVNGNVKAKIMNLPKRNGDLNIDEFTVEVNDCYEKESTDKSAATESAIAGKIDDRPTSKSNTKSDSSFIIVEPGEDDVFVEEGQTTDKQASKEDLKNQNLRMLARLNRRSRNTSSRTSSLTSRQTNERLMNSSFKKVKFGSSIEDNEESDSKESKIAKQPTENDQMEKRTVLVDVLYSSTFVDVHWQDNTIETDIPLSHLSEEIDNLIQKYYPGNFVDFTNEMKHKDGLIPTYGVIQKVNQSTNIAEVKWFYESMNGNKDEVNNNSSETKTWITNESLFNLRSSCIHFHLHDLVVESGLITNFAKTRIEDVPKLIGTIKQISTDGKALIEFIDGTESWKKLVELVSFFDVSLQFRTLFMGTKLSNLFPPNKKK